MLVIGFLTPLGVGALKIEMQIFFADGKDVYIVPATIVKLNGTIVTAEDTARVVEIGTWLKQHDPAFATYTVSPKNQGRALTIDFTSEV